MRGGAAVEGAVYQLYQTAFGGWARWRYRDAFNRVARFCLFIGYPRSGHSMVGAVLNAHRDAVISHELHAAEVILTGCSRDVLYSRILARASWFNLRGNTSNYRYQVANQWQGRFDTLRVIGDKRGGGVTRAIAADPDFLVRVRALVAIPLRLIHVVRNPFDNISAVSIWHNLSLAESIDFYFALCETTRRMDEFCGPGEVITIRHEEVIRDPRAVISDLCAFLDLECYPGYLDDCCGAIFSAPSYTRRKVVWPPDLVAAVERRARRYPFLDGYEFELGEDRLNLYAPRQR